MQGINTKLFVDGHIRESATFNASGLTVELSAGNDSLSIFNSAFTQFVNIDLGSGNDVLDCNNFSSGADIAIDAGTGDDDVWLAACSCVSIRVDAGDGRDIVALLGTEADEDMAVEMGRGNRGRDGHC